MNVLDALAALVVALADAVLALYDAPPTTEDETIVEVAARLRALADERRVAAA